MPEDNHLTPLGWLAQNGPRDELEAQAAAHALIARRELDEDLRSLDELSSFERKLADRAASEAHRAVKDAVNKAIGATAETISAIALQSALANIGRTLDFEPPQTPFPAGFTTPARVAASRVVSGAQRAVVREAELELRRLRLAHDGRETSQ
ncbi:MAG TPA: hypothetical protein VMY78_11860 [Solirubrobacteraceae bacterium]|nr:hypothetical protein [Solirubrobacteraceae bacterium]